MLRTVLKRTGDSCVIKYSSNVLPNGNILCSLRGTKAIYIDLYKVGFFRGARLCSWASPREIHSGQSGNGTDVLLLQVSFQQCSLPILIYTLLLTEGRADEALQSSDYGLLENSEELERKSLS